jgi:hypothetical protein
MTENITDNNLKTEIIETNNLKTEIIETNNLKTEIIETNNLKTEIIETNNLKPNINIEYINKRIEKEICVDTINKLKDLFLIDEYKKCKSVQNNIKKLELILKKYNIETKIIELILNEYILDLIPAGTKGAIRGNKFNNIVKNTIDELKLNVERFEICFEKKCETCVTTEIPDWYILEKSTGKVIIGMNQLDLWGGGQQLNRGSKYLIDNKNNTDKSKLLCVVCNNIKFTSKKNKAYKLFEVGFTNNTLCYILNLGSIINDYFN